MEPYYYQKMNKPQQAAYHAMQQGVLALADEIQLPRIPAEELYDVFFRLRLDHPEIFWVVSYRYRYYQDSPNIIFVPEYLFEKNNIRNYLFHELVYDGVKIYYLKASDNFIKDS